VRSSDGSCKKLTNKGIPDGTLENSAVFDLLRETYDHINCLQRAVAVMCEGFHDFRAEYAEDITEVKWQLQELRKNKVWFPRERA
jgi:hypothetical protein